MRRRFARDVGVLTAANLVSAGLGFLQGLLVARWLGPKGYGLAALIMSYPAFVLTVLSFRTGQGAVKYLGEFAATGQTARLLTLCRFGYLLNLAVAVVTLAIVTVTGRWIEGSLLKTNGTLWLLIAYAAAYVPSSFAETSVAVFSTLRQFTTLAWVRVLVTVFRVALVVALLIAGYGAAGVVAANAVTISLRGVGLLILAHRVVVRTWGATWLQASWRALEGKWREVIGFFLYTNLTALVAVAVTQLDVLALGYFQGPAMAGNYNLAKVFGTAVGTLGRTLQTVIYPRFAALWGGRQTVEFEQTLRRAALQIGLPLGLGFLLGLPLVPVVLPVIVGTRFDAAIPIVSVAYVMTAMSLGLFWLRPWFLSTGRVRAWFGLSLVNSLVALIAFPVSAALAGGVGVALARLGGRFLRNLGAVLIVLRATRRHEAPEPVGHPPLPAARAADVTDVEVP